MGPVTRSRYRWVVLAAGTGAQTSFAALTIGVAVIAPAVRDRYDLSLELVGVALASYWVGAAITLLAWGLAADRFGERGVLVWGLGLCGVLAAIAPHVSSFALFTTLLALAGAAGASVNSASGRAVMQWFGPAERGLALGVRQTAVPIGGVVAALALPWVEDAGGVEGAFLVLGGLCVAGALAGAAVLREGRIEVEEDPAPWSMRDTRLWRVSLASSGFVVTQIAVAGYVVLFLHDERGFSEAQAAAVLAVMNALAIVLRIAAGRWSDVIGKRVVPLRRIGAAVVLTVVLVAALVDAPAAALVPALVLAGALSMAWNGLAFTAAAELAGRARAGAAIGVQQTALSVAGVAVPLAFAALVAASSWQVAFGLSALGPLAGWWALGPLTERPPSSR